MSSELELRTSVEAWLAAYAGDVPVVVVPIYNAFDDTVQCVDSLRHTCPPRTPILLLDDASSDKRMAPALQSRAQHEHLFYARKATNTGFVGTVNSAFEWCAPHDVVIVNSDTVMPFEWLERLRSAAYSRSNVATATPLTNNGTIVSVPYRNHPTPELPKGYSLAEVDKRICAASLRLRPLIPTAVGHCVYFRRQALDTIGGFDVAFAPGYGEEVDFSQRAASAGFCHVVADDLFIFHKGSRSFGPGSKSRDDIQVGHERLINKRYPSYFPWMLEVSKSRCHPLALAIERARAALLAYDIAVDATCVNGVTTGTQVLVLELIRALATTRNSLRHLSIIVGDKTPSDALCGVNELVDEVITISELKRRELPAFDLIHRPFQVVSENDLKLLRSVARRFIVSHLDCISYANPSYRPSFEEWAAYRRTTEQVFALADGIVFISSDAACDAAQQGLVVPEARRSVTYVGVDHQLHRAFDARMPDGVERFCQQPFLLLIGTNFKHKNRVYAIRLLSWLIEKYNWQGQLVFAGPSVASGGSVAEEAESLAQFPKIKDRVHDIGGVNEAEKKWLLKNAALVLYPSIYEGFGLVPFEAAAADTVALSTDMTSLREVLGPEVECLDGLDSARGADSVWKMLTCPAASRRQIEVIRKRAEAFSWETVAQRTWTFYEQILRTSSRAPELQAASETAPRTVQPSRRDHPVHYWAQRASLAVRVLLTKGPRALVKEINQYLRWRASQF